MHSAPPDKVSPAARFYVLAVIALLIVVAAVWIFPFDGYYGWHSDDWMGFRKAMATLVDWRAAFIVRINLLQPYFFLYSWLPLKFGPDLSSLPIPFYGDAVGQFRFLALFTIAFHLGMLALFAFHARRLVPSAGVAFLATALFAINPELALWMPQSETRFVVVPTLLLAMMLLAPRAEQRATVWRYFAAGFLFSLSQSLHYTALYLAAPYLAARFVLEMVLLPDRWRSFRLWFVLGLGVLTPMVMVEAASWLGGIPFAQGPIMSLIYQGGTSHTIHGAYRWLIVLKFAADYALQIALTYGLVYVALAVLGLVLFTRRALRMDLLHRIDHLAIAFAVVLGVLVVVTSPTLPGPRKFVPLLPFIGLFVAIGFYRVALYAGTRLGPFMRRGALALVMVMLIAPSLWFSAEIHHRHYAMGPALRQTYALQQKEGGRLHWLGSRLLVYEPFALVRTAADNDLLALEFPYALFDNYPAFADLLRAVPPVVRADRPWSSTLVWANFGRFWGVDFRAEPELTEFRVYRIGDIKAALATLKPLAVTALRSGSGLSAEEGERLLDGAVPHHDAYWRKNLPEGPHEIEITLGAQTVLAGITLHGEGFRPEGLRLDSASIHGAGDDGERHLLATLEHGEHDAIVRLGWTPQPLRRLWVSVGAFRRYTYGRSLETRLAEIGFPGFLPERTEPPPDDRATLMAYRFTPHDLNTAAHFGNLDDGIDGVPGPKVALVARGGRFPALMRVNVNGIDVPWALDHVDGKVIAALPPLVDAAAPLAIELRDRLGRPLSNREMLSPP